MPAIKIAGFALVILGLIFAGMAQAQPADRQSLAGDSATACKALTSAKYAARFAQIPDAITAINSARIVAAGGRHTATDDDLPEICRVEGYIAPTVGFLLRMPTKGWNGRFLMGGCSGPCGNYFEDRVDPALIRGYAVVTTDMGHKGEGYQWAYNNLQGQVDFAYRATHVTAVAAKEIVKAFYDRPAAHNYYLGCSTGGRQGMTEAQRFPDDFEGIVAGAPVIDIGNFPFFSDWGGIANARPDGKPILPPEKLSVIHKAVVKACHANDGLEDGIIQNPLACHWDPHTLLCKAGDQPDCLTNAQADVLQKVYDGPTNSKGEKLFWGRLRGSEDQWGSRLNRFDSEGTSISGILAFSPSASPAFKGTDFNYDRDPARMASAAALFNALNPDLSPFKKAGGKLILYHGLSDSSVPPQSSISYYETAVRTLGGRAQTDPFFRLFTLPGVGHCRGGIGNGSVDWLTALENWVEKGQAPDMLIAYHPVKDFPSAPREITDYGVDFIRLDRFPLKPGDYDRARPLYPYPTATRYLGKGDPNDPASFGKAQP